MYHFVAAELRLFHDAHLSHGQLASIAYIASLTPVLFVTSLIAIALSLALAIAAVQALVHLVAYASIPIVGYPKIFLRPVQRAFAIATMSIGMLASVNITYASDFRPCIATLATLSPNARTSIAASFQAATQYGVVCPMQTYPPAIGVRAILRHPHHIVGPQPT